MPHKCMLLSAIQWRSELPYTADLYAGELRLDAVLDEKLATCSSVVVKMQQRIK